MQHIFLISLLGIAILTSCKKREIELPPFPDEYTRSFEKFYGGDKEDRANEYPSIQEQLDMQYWDSVNGTTTWKDAVAKVKADNPKPE